MIKQTMGFGYLCAIALLPCACDQGRQRGDTVELERPAQSGSIRAIGWNRLRRGMDPVDVLSLLNEPREVGVTVVNTHWLFGDRAHVVFDTRTMKVERWRPPDDDSPPPRDEGVEADKKPAPTKPREARYTVGWDRLRRGMDPCEVLALIDKPIDIKVSNVNTHWHYSDRAGEGPCVVFATRTMRVERWQAPASR